MAETVQENGPERTVYAITDEGRAELTRWLDDVEAPAPTCRAVCCPAWSWRPPWATPPAATCAGSAPRTSPACGS
ncbi:MAG: hypothetical protein HOV97_10130 [Nonomuraea sp.]|nr:hypothetical protein [Nonomuraea sp.]